ncbi:hypothetical protein GCM10018987_58620 [Streptomyces cremeus]
MWLIFFIVCLVLSGLTAFPLVTELNWLADVLKSSPLSDAMPGFTEWIERCREGLVATQAKYPFILYGTDWLAYAHLVIAVAFHGPYRDPVRNIWVIEFGMIACAGIIPLALVCGPIRGIPFGWSLIDMAFGVFGGDPAGGRAPEDQAVGGADGTGHGRGAGARPALRRERRPKPTRRPLPRRVLSRA